MQRVQSQRISLVQDGHFRKGWLVLAFLFVTLRSVAQVPARWSGLGIDANFTAGKVIKHNSKFLAPIPDLSTTYEICFVQQTYGKKEWHERRNYPRVGLGVKYSVYGIDSVYGRCINLYPVLELPVVRGKKLEWTARISCGLGWVTRHYERTPTWDTLNNAIGSHLNNYTAVSTELRYKINKHLAVQAGANFWHISNSGTRQPNKGVNSYGGHVGLRYYPITSEPDKIVRGLKPLRKRWLLQARLGISGTESGLADGPLYPVYLGSLYVSKRWKSYNKVFGGVDYSYHKDIEAFLKNNEISVGEEKKHSWKSAVFVGNEFVFGRVGIMLQIGYYLKEAALRLDPYYQKLGGNLYLVQREKGPIKELFITVLVKTHKAQAELAELTLGVGL